MTSKLVKGHTLVSEGAAHDVAGVRVRGRSGRGKCSCGLLSDDLPSGGRRKQWHREHKDQVLKEG